MAMTHVDACVAYETTIDGDVDFASTFTPDVLMYGDGTLPS